MTIPGTTGIRVRWLRPHDYKAVCRIEIRCEPQHPWRRADFFQALRQEEFVGIVAEDPHRTVVGFLIYKLTCGSITIVKFRARAGASQRDAELQLLAYVKGKLNPVGRTKLILPVNERDLAMQQCLVTAGFVAVGVVRGYFAETTGGDAYVMEYRHPV